MKKSYLLRYIDIAKFTTVSLYSLVNIVFSTLLNQ